ncbi:uncharacterized protein [Antennarius striatus]|uniref:uncharacterized protein n=1 Tax=Antennarius striatus TaxID=241820 RepID=UPI0035B49DC4
MDRDTFMHSALNFIHLQLVQLTKDCNETYNNGSVSEEFFMELQTKLEKILHQTYLASCPTVEGAQMADFEVYRLIGSGGFGSVSIVRHNQTVLLAMERGILTFTDNPFVVSLLCSFATMSDFCMVMEHVEGRDCAALLRQHGPLNLDLVHLYVAETTLALEYIHSYGIIHRDLKPSNMLISSTGHVKLADFGLALIGSINMTVDLTEDSNIELAVTEFERCQMVGTLPYMAPEMLLSLKYGKPVDWWALGIVMYELLMKSFPFEGETDRKCFESIINKPFSWPSNSSKPPKEAQDFVYKLLSKDPLVRLGTNGACKLKEHCFFSGLEWNTLLNQEVPRVLDKKGELALVNPENPGPLVYARNRVPAWINSGKPELAVVDEENSEPAMDDICNPEAELAKLTDPEPALVDSENSVLLVVDAGNTSMDDKQQEVLLLLGESPPSHVAAESKLIVKERLEALQCHFTWNLDSSRSKLLSLKDKLDDIGAEGGYSWLGHIYNLRGFIQHQLGFADKARLHLCKAAEAFRQMRNTISEEGSWLVVNYSNLAWLHQHLGEHAQSWAYLSKVDALMEEYPSPSEDELHPEIYAEKAWTLMKFSKHQKLLAADFFQRAIRMQPGGVEWRTSLVLTLHSAARHKTLSVDLWEKMSLAKEQDPDNLYLAAVFLEACAKTGTNVQDEARKLARRVLRKPQSSYGGIKPLLRLYRKYISTDEAIDLVEEALERHPRERYLKRCAAICYKMKILLDKDNPLERSMISRAVSLHRELVSLYPQSALKIKIDLANIYGESDHQDEADRIYDDLLESDLDPGEMQMLFNYYAKYVHLIRKESYTSIEYHMRAAEIPLSSIYRDDSIRTLERIKDRNRNQMCPKISTFLEELED